jgi:enterochelin esterase-like enzyme
VLSKYAAIPPCAARPDPLEYALPKQSAVTPGIPCQAGDLSYAGIVLRPFKGISLEKKALHSIPTLPRRVLRRLRVARLDWVLNPYFLTLLFGSVAVVLAYSVAPARAVAVLAERDAIGNGPGSFVTFYSPALDRKMNYWVYLPPDYAKSNQSYPVLYMLHGRDATSAQWKSFGLFTQADQLIRAGTIAPLIIVTPQGDFGYWMNHVDSGPRWGDYVTQDLIGHIDATYRTLPDRAHRAIGGVSMGGHGAIQLALNHPALFAVVGGHSPVFRNQAQALPFFGTGAEYRKRDPVSLVRARPQALSFALWLDMGTSDPWIESTAAFHALLTADKIAHSWHTGPGRHEADYWERHIPAYLRWYDAALHNAAKPVEEVESAKDVPRVPRIKEW